MTKLNLIFIILSCLLLSACSSTSSSISNLKDSYSISGNTIISEDGTTVPIPDIRFASITDINVINCTISGKIYEKNRDLYFVEAMDKSGNTIRFRSSKDYYNYIQINDNVVITECFLDYPLGTSKLEYYIECEKLSGVFVNSSVPSTQVSATVGKTTNIVNENVIRFKIVDFSEEKKDFPFYISIKGYGFPYFKSENHCYVVAQTLDEKINIRFENTNIWDTRTIGDTLDILVQEIDPLFEETYYRYFFNGEALNTKQENQ